MAIPVDLALFLMFGLLRHFVDLRDKVPGLRNGEVLLAPPLVRVAVKLQGIADGKLESEGLLVQLPVDML
jgi:hypothetical protein